MSSHSATLQVRSPFLQRFADRFHVLIQTGESIKLYIRKELNENYVCCCLYTKEPSVDIIKDGSLWLISPHKINRMQNFYHSDYWPGVAKYAKAALLARGRL